MKLHMLLLAASVGLAGCEVHHIHHFNKNDLVGCDCDKNAASTSGQHLPMSYGENVKVLPPIYQPIAPYAYQAPVYQAPYQAPPPAPKVHMPEYYKLTPVEPGQMPQNGQAQPMGQPMSYSPYQQQPYPQQQMQPVQQPVMPIQMSSNSSKNSDSNIKTYLFQPAGGVVYQY
ncbi:hypothetical protein [Litoribrevibacter albus]|uniref:Uncharacterized protein n=1 Tax=Litoribrevibacter albus TaxID=1473156 RepID=A0AA37SFG7_9GAMM|nr:hypothetical protein [Litoribrevibacter albus]GLQ33381.1 hypothetical protein GCM10007876_38610 [Litoribrevibacter albus]